ncbi:hypothetical protein CCP2SC5_120028 [Azospirillaceae bacterium]
MRSSNKIAVCNPNKGVVSGGVLFCGVSVFSVLAMFGVSVAVTPALAASVLPNDSYYSYEGEDTGLKNKMGQEISRGVVGQTTRAIGNRVSTALTGRGNRGGASQSSEHVAHVESSGVSGGGGLGKFGVWGNVSYLQLSNSNATVGYAGHSVNGLVGGDFLYNDMFMGGVAFGYENVNLTPYLSSLSDTDGFTISPYVGAKFFGGRVVVDALFGYTWLDGRGSANRDVPLASGSYTSKGSRVSAATNVTYNQFFSDWTLSPSVGVTFAHQNVDGYTYRNSLNVPVSITRGLSYVLDLKAGARLAYNYKDIELYTSHYYLYDLVPLFAKSGKTTTGLGISSIDRDEFLSTLGVSYFYNDNVSGSLEASSSFGRREVGNNVLLGSVRVTF